MSESYQELYKKLKESEFACVQSGFRDIDEVYAAVESEYPKLCDDTILCSDVCGQDSSEPEWKHRVRTVQQDLKRKEGTRVKRLNDQWFYEPVQWDIPPLGDADPENFWGFEVGKKYNRWELHDVFGGQRYRGIATPSDYPFVFIFTGDAGSEYGYEDRFLDDGTFIYTGEGSEGDMTMTGGNEAIRTHAQDGEELHLFEDTDEPWIVTYVGEYQYTGHQIDTLRDKNDEDRDAIRFRLEPIGGNEIEIEEGTPSSLSDEELFKKAKQSAPRKQSGKSSTGGSTRSESSGGRSYPRSEIVKKFARRVAEGVCQGCGEDAPFVNKRGQPFLEVHHLHRLSDDGADDPENVIAICPNCHRRAHQSRDRKEFNQKLIEKAEERNKKYLVPTSN